MTMYHNISGSMFFSKSTDLLWLIFILGCIWEGLAGRVKSGYLIKPQTAWDNWERVCFSVPCFSSIHVPFHKLGSLLSLDFWYFDPHSYKICFHLCSILLALHYASFFLVPQTKVLLTASDDDQFNVPMNIYNYNTDHTQFSHKFSLA